MSDVFTQFSFPNIRESDAVGFRQFMTEELISRGIIQREITDCTLDSSNQYCDWESHLSAKGFHELFGTVAPRHGRGLVESGLNPKVTSGNEPCPTLYNKVGISLAAGRWITFGLYNEVHELSIFCPICHAEFRSDDENLYSPYNQCIRGQYNFMDGEEIGRCLCDNCGTNLANDDWRDEFGQRVALPSFFHIKVWNWFIGYSLEESALVFKEMLFNISGEDIYMTHSRI